MDRPKLRNVERIPLTRDGQPHVVLRDPMAVAEAIAIDADFVPVLDALDGSRTVAQIRQTLLMGRGLDVALDELQAFVAELDEVGLLEGEAFRARWARLYAAFMDAPVRAPTLAGTLYPAEPTVLRERLAVELGPVVLGPSGTVALLLPHGPPALVGAVVAAALAALPDPGAFEAIVMLGADHHPGLLPFAALDRPYATPLGVVDHATDLGEALARRVPWIDREAIRHRGAHSLEWATLYLQHAWGDRVPPCLPILCGATAVTGDGGLHDGVAELVAALEALTEDRRVLYVAAAELTHAGAAYGRTTPDAAGLDQLAARDRDVLEALARGRTREVLARADDRLGQGRPSGLPVLATLAELATELRGELRGYALAPLEADAPGWAGVAALAWSQRPGHTGGNHATIGAGGE